MSPLLRNSLFAVGLALILWIGYTMYFPTLPAVESTLSASTPALRNAQTVLVQLRQIEQVNIKTALFVDPRFESLTDFRKEIVPEPVGRENPFVPYSTTKQ